MARFDKGQDLIRGTWQDFARFDKGGYGKKGGHLARFGKIRQDLTKGAWQDGKIWQDLARFGKIWQIDIDKMGDMARFGKI